MIGVWVEPEIKELVKKIAKVKGIRISEYCRQLINQDLDKRTIFTDMLKEE